LREREREREGEAVVLFGRGGMLIGESAEVTTRGRGGTITDSSLSDGGGGADADGVGVVEKGAMITNERTR
jgi:hypothetical protein